MLHTILPTYNNIIGWTKAKGKYCYSFHRHLLIIDCVDLITNKAITINEAINSNSVVFRCSLSVNDVYKLKKYNKGITRHINRKNSSYDIIGCYKTPEEAFDAAIKELEWTELQILPGVPSDYYAPYQ